MASKILTKNKASKISILFDDKDVNDSAARRFILFYYISLLKQNKETTEFDITMLGNWMLDHYQLFIDEFAGTRTRRSYQLQKKRSYIRNRVNELVLLGLIDERGRILAKKKSTEKRLYAFTKEGCIFAWLVQAKYAVNQDQRHFAIKNFFSELIGHVIESDTSFTSCFVRCINRCMEKDIFAGVDEGYLDTIIDLFPIAKNFFHFFRFLVLYGFYTNDPLSRIFLDIIEESDEEVQHLILLQLKLDIESNYYDGISTSKECEKERYDSIQDHNMVVLQGYCLECKRLWPYRMDTLEFLKLGRKTKSYAPDGGLFITSKLICPHCNKQDCRFMVPIYFVPAGFIKPVTSIEYMERWYNDIQDKGPKIDPSTQISDETQKVI